MTTFQVGDHVQTWFDTGAFGVTPLHGDVVAAGPKRYVVEWESGIRNRLDQTRTDVTLVKREGCYCRLAAKPTPDFPLTSTSARGTLPPS